MNPWNVTENDASNETNGGLEGEWTPLTSLNFYEPFLADLMLFGTLRLLRQKRLCEENEVNIMKSASDIYCPLICMH